MTIWFRICKKDSELITEVLKSIEFMDLKIDHKKNNNDEQIFSTNDLNISAFAFDTNEELVVARETKKIIQSLISYRLLKIIYPRWPI